MCGIAGYYLRKPIKGLNHDKLIDKLLDGIDWRGGEATGMALFGPDGLLDHQRAGADARVFTMHRREAPRDTRIALLHTRLATQGHPAFVENNHPVVNQGVFVIHNGHVSNDRELWKKVGAEKRQADVDSEIIPAIIAQHGWESAVKALEEIEGSMALAAVHQDYPDELILAKGEQSPLIYAYTDTIIVWASTEIALMNAWAAAIGTPPKATRLKQLKLGDFLRVKDGEIEKGTFEVAFDYYSTWKKYNTTGKSAGAAAASCDSHFNVSYYRGGKKVTKSVGVKTVDDWLKERADEDLHKANAAELTEEINKARARTEEIMAMPEGWWDDEDLMTEFNGLWDRIRVLRDMLEDSAWEEFESRYHWHDRLEDEEETEIELQCPGCYNIFSMGEMQELVDGGQLYCWDCCDEWEHPSVTGHKHPTGNATADKHIAAGELQWKTIAPGTEIMVRVNPETGEEIE